MYQTYPGSSLETGDYEGLLRKMLSACVQGQCAHGLATGLLQFLTAR